MGTGPENSKAVPGGEDWRVAAEQYPISRFPLSSQETEKKKPKLRLGFDEAEFPNELDPTAFH